jgi:hypothetical protein
MILGFSSVRSPCHVCQAGKDAMKRVADAVGIKQQIGKSGRSH